MPTIVISHKAYAEIRKFYVNVARRYSQTYSLLLLKNISEAQSAINLIENGLPRRKPTISRWFKYYMASYFVNGKVRWNYAYRIEGDTIYVEDACHSQNMSEFSTTVVPTNKIKYRRLPTKPLFGYSFVMNDKKQYNLIDSNGNLITKWFNAIKTPFTQPYGQYQLIAYVNIGGYVYALGLDGKTYNLNRAWKDLYAESINSMAFAQMITEEIDKCKKNVIRLTERQLKEIIQESIYKVLSIL